MSQSEHIGIRVRARRVKVGQSQQQLAKAVGISPSYLNLMEHGKRRIGGSVLGGLAQALGVDPNVLTAAVATEGLVPLQDRAGEPLEGFAAQFPGWAGVVAEQAGRVSRLEAQVATMADRLAHDPTLAGALHQVVSTVTSIRSTASILVEGAGDRDWEARFHQNIHADSLRLAEVTQALAAYLGGAPEKTPVTAMDEATAFFEERGHFFEEIERGADVSLAGLSAAAHQIVAAWLDVYAQDARALPLTEFAAAAAAVEYDVAAVAARFAQPLGAVMRRLASLPARRGQPMMGLAICDGAGVVTRLKRTAGFDMVFGAGGCPLWPLYAALGQGMRPVQEVVVMPGKEAPRMTAYAVSQPIGTPSFDGRGRIGAVMLVVGDAPQTPPHPVGPGCAVCPREDCTARRIA